MTTVTINSATIRIDSETVRVDTVEVADGGVGGWPRQRLTRRRRPPAEIAVRRHPAAGYEDDFDAEAVKRRRAAQSERRASDAKEGEDRRERARKAAFPDPPAEVRAEVAPAAVNADADGDVDAEMAEVLALVIQQEALVALQMLIQSGEIGEDDFELPLAA